MKTPFYLLLLCIFLLCSITTETFSQDSKMYQTIQKNLAKGWNTWNASDVLSFVHLPEGFAISLKPVDIVSGKINSVRLSGVKLLAHAADGSYTAAEFRCNETNLMVQSAQTGFNLVILITVTKTSEFSNSALVISGDILWNKTGTIKRNDKVVNAKFGNRALRFGTSVEMDENVQIKSASPYLPVSLSEKEIGIYTGAELTTAQIKEIVEKQKAAFEKKPEKYNQDSKRAMKIESTIGWNTVYNPESGKVIVITKREIFTQCPDYKYNSEVFARALITGEFNRELAAATIIETVNSIYTAVGLDTFPYFPPYESITLYHLFKKHDNIKWAVEEVYPQLLYINRRKHEKNTINGWITKPALSAEKADACIPVCSPALSAQYKNAPVDAKTNCCKIADAGFLGLYIADCKALAQIAEKFDFREDAAELTARAKVCSDSLQILWNEEQGCYLNKRIDTDQPVEIFPAENFYSLLSGVPTTEQAEKMTEKYFSQMVLSANTNPLENLLLYMALRDYKLQEAESILVKNATIPVLYLMEALQQH